MYLGGNYSQRTEPTQGSIIYGMRSQKYPDVMIYGIIITAACDMAQEKVDKIYYLPGVPVEDWIFSEVGFKKSLQECFNNLENNLKDKCKKEGLSWELLNTFSQEELTRVLDETNQKGDPSLKELFCKYKRYTSGILTMQEKGEIIEEENKCIKNFITNMINGKNMQFIFIPATACGKETSIQNGIIVDLQELDFMTPDEIKKLCQYEIDEKTLDGSEKEEYNRRFFILNNPGYAMLQGRLLWPWTEYTMQHFSNGFIRIGVDSLEKPEIMEMIEKICTRRT